MSKRVGIFGGSFNPIHNGHIALARQLRQTASLDEVWLMVSPQNPLKQSSTELLADQQRFLMARIALYGESGIKASKYEFGLPRPSYTWNTLQHLRADFPQHDFSLLIGGDNWQNFHRWYHAADIISNYPIVVYPRRDADGSISAPATNSFNNAHVIIADAELLDISSTEIRQRVRQGKSIDKMVPEVIAPLVRHFY